MDYNPKEIPDYPVHPEGMYHLRVNGAPKKNENQTLKMNGRYEILGPEDARVGAGMQDTFWLGSEDDPMAEKPATKKANFGKWTRFVKACEVQLTGDLEEEAEAVDGAEFMAKVTVSKDGTKNYVNGYYRLGTQEAKLKNPPERKVDPEPERSQVDDTNGLRGRTDLKDEE